MKLALAALHESVSGGQRYLPVGEINLGFFRHTAKLTAEPRGYEGNSPLYAVIAGKLAEIIAVADPVKDTTPPPRRAARPWSQDRDDHRRQQARAREVSQDRGRPMFSQFSAKCAAIGAMRDRHRWLIVGAAIFIAALGGSRTGTVPVASADPAAPIPHVIGADFG